MYVDAPLTLHNVNDLQLAKHMLEVRLQLFGLPVAKLLIRIFVIECYGLVTLVNLGSISFLLIALHYANDGLVP